MEPERIDLSALDPAAEQPAYERMVRRIMDAAAPELTRRARETGPLGLVERWARPTLAAAAIIAALAAGALFATDRPEPAMASASVVEALGVPSPAADWLEAGRQPDAGDLVLAMERRR
jgi:hypothetical protein